MIWNWRKLATINFNVTWFWTGNIFIINWIVYLSRVTPVDHLLSTTGALGCLSATLHGELTVAPPPTHPLGPRTVQFTAGSSRTFESNCSFCQSDVESLRLTWCWKNKTLLIFCLRSSRCSEFRKFNCFTCTSAQRLAQSFQ